jgi:hypothetical protein
MNLYDEAGITATVPFCYGSASDELIEPPTPAECACDISDSLQIHERIMGWVYESDEIDFAAFRCRAIVACWKFFPPTRELGIAKISRRFGVKLSPIQEALQGFKSEFKPVLDCLSGKISQWPREITAAIKLQEPIWRWVYDSDIIDLDGFDCRSIVACWMFYHPIEEYSMTTIAGRFGKQKQSLHRAFTSFKQEFPNLTKYLAHTKQ